MSSYPLRHSAALTSGKQSIQIAPRLLPTTVSHNTLTASGKRIFTKSIATRYPLNSVYITDTADGYLHTMWHEIPLASDKMYTVRL